MISKDKMFGFLKRWQALERQAADLDFTRGVFARDFRAAFPPGPGGDQAFVDAGVEHLGWTSSHGVEYVERAALATLVPDEGQFKRLGGYRQIRHLLRLPSKREQVQAIEVAKSTTRALQTVVLERLRALGASPPARPRVPSTTSPARATTTLKPADVRGPGIASTAAEADARVLAAFILARLPSDSIPEETAAVIRRYLRIPPGAARARSASPPRRPAGRA